MGSANRKEGSAALRLKKTDMAKFIDRKLHSIQFRKNLRNAISECGKWIHDNAEDLVPEIDGLCSLKISVTFDSENVQIPTIKVEPEYVSMAMIEAMFPHEKRDMEKKNHAGV